jgi:hypothetical protein
MSEKVNFLRDWLGWIVSVFIAILGLILGISGDFIKNNPIYFVWICIIGLIFLSAAIHFVIYFYKQNDYEILYNVKSIKNKIINYSTSPSFPTLIFIGELESSIIQTIYDNHISNTKKVKIISTNSSSYAKLTEELKRNIFLKEAKDDDSKFIHKFFSHTQYRRASR